MIQKGEINEQVLYLIVDRDSIGQHSTYITKLSQGCRVLKLSKFPEEKDELTFDKEYAEFMPQILSEVKWDTQVLFIIVCDLNVTVKQIMDTPEEEVTGKEFAWRKPVMKPYDRPINWNVRTNKPTRVKTIIDWIFK